MKFLKRAGIKRNPWFHIFPVTYIDNEKKALKLSYSVRLIKINLLELICIKCIAQHRAA